ncbi:MAG: DNA-3-methyladenine glycosylase [Nitrospirota bacterium]|jgi:DNA-3-methyladenine glycosylase II
MTLLSSGERLAKINRNAHTTACSHLTKVDPVLRRIIARVGPCTLRPRRQYFATLCDSIISQQLSTKVAEVIFNRFVALYAQRRPAPRAVARTPAHQLRAVGLSGQKATYLKDLAAGFLEGRIQPSRFARLSNEEIIAALVSLRGIGRWTAEMFLIFSLNRPDVLPVDDLGIKKAIQRAYRLRALPSSATIRKIGAPWRPYETIACWYLWRSLAKG